MFALFALFALFVCLVLPTRCCAADLKAHHTVRAAFLSIHADGDGDGDCNGDCLLLYFSYLFVWNQQKFINIVRR